MIANQPKVNFFGEKGEIKERSIINRAFNSLTVIHDYGAEDGVGDGAKLYCERT